MVDRHTFDNVYTSAVRLTKWVDMAEEATFVEWGRTPEQVQEQYQLEVNWKTAMTIFMLLWVVCGIAWSNIFGLDCRWEPENRNKREESVTRNLIMYTGVVVVVFLGAFVESGGLTASL